ncbi:MAG: hypothetical protein J0M04_18210 [Verrucomicrobia bacterium]|nr:hypothetical protein [Verrucomicrobiota bacterium]
MAQSDWQSIRTAHEAWRHGFRLVDGRWQAHNPGQQWTTTFDGRGFVAIPKGADWTWGLELKSYGFGSRQQRVTGAPEVAATGQRLTCRWNDTIEEWLVNDRRGLEHGFTLAGRPEGGLACEPLVLTLVTVGGLRPSLLGDAGTVHFRDDAGATLISYSGLRVWDADGQVLPSRFERPEGREFSLVVEDRAARYPLTIDPIAQQAYLKASNSGAGDDFGRSVAISGDTVVVGAMNEDSGTTGINSTPDGSAPGSGAAYVFVRSGATWAQQAYLKASNTGSADGFGCSVAISGDTVVVGALYESSSTTGINSTPDEGARRSGAAYVFFRSGATWSQQAYIKPSNTRAYDGFGHSVAVSGDTVAIKPAAYGLAYVFVRSGGVWAQETYFSAGGAYGEVAVSGDTVAVGGMDSHAVSVFVRSGGIWTWQATLKASNAEVADDFGISVAISGDTLVAGSWLEDSSTTGVNSVPNEGARDSGAAYVFVRNGGVWTQQAYLKASNTGRGDSFGNSVAISGDTVVVGASDESSSTTGVNSTPNDSALNSGAAYVFVRSGGVWTQQAYLKASNTGEGDFFGSSVAVSGNTVVAGAPYEDSGTTGVNSTPDEIAGASGAAYVYSGLGPQPDVSVSLGLSPAGIYEDASGSLACTFTRNSTSGSLVVNITIGGTATMGNDYAVIGAVMTGTSGIVTIPAGQSIAQVIIDPLADTAAEADESVIIGIAPGAGYQIGATAQQTGMILDASRDGDGDGMPDFWEQENGLEASVADALGDKDGDGLKNLLEFALARRANRPDSAGAVVMTTEGGYLVLTITRNPNASRLQFTVEVSDDLAGWESGTGHTTILEDTPALLKVRSQDPISSKPKAQFRLKVVHASP